MNREKITRLLLASRGKDGFFESRLSDSAVSTAVTLVALEVVDREKYVKEIRAARQWLVSHQNADGLYGDSPDSPSNLTATFMAFVALRSDVTFWPRAKKAERFLRTRFGDFSFESVRRGILAEYGRDLTFSVPLLAMATAAGFFENPGRVWRSMPRFSFEAAAIPERFFRWLNLPVVSYAIPALISVGLAQAAFTPGGLIKSFRGLFRKKALRVLVEKQPPSGGFLEAAPLTAFCLLCLSVAGLRDHQTAREATRFLIETRRENGAWPIDVNLRQWTTSLATGALAESFSEEEKKTYRDRILSQQTTAVHPFTRSKPGGWGWTTSLGGAPPDGDDTAAALVALHRLGEPVGPAVERGIEWLLDLQNRDGGIPTFCRGWSQLPFDRSCPDLSAHAYRAFSLYESELPRRLQKRVVSAKRRILAFLEKTQAADGSFSSLWFGDQTSEDGTAPVYGTAVVLEHLDGMEAPFLTKAVDFLLQTQHASGGWGNVAENGRDYVIFTARCVGALRHRPTARETAERGLDFLRPFAENPEKIAPEPVGLYFAHLWYDEKLYAPVFLAALGGEP